MAKESKKGKFAGCLILSDLDGTLLDEHQKVPENSREAIAYFESEGGTFTFDTGRLCRNILERLPGIEEIVNAPALTVNGACLYDLKEKKALIETFLEPIPSRKVLNFVRENYAEVCPEVSTATGVYSDRYEGLVALDYAGEKKKILTVAPFDEWPVGCWYKMLFRGRHEELERLREDLVREFPNRFEIFWSDPSYLEVCRLGNNKAALIPALRQRLGAEKVYAVGDNENDMAMLLAADVAACPANALESVKKICDVILCDHNEGALADLIRRMDCGLIG